MSIRVTGMYSGLDTESIISELVSAQSVKKSSLVKAQTKLSWKQDAWKALNTKIYSFYTNTLSNMRYESSYMKKTTKVSNSNAISVVTGADAVDGVRTVSVNKLAKTAYLTGADLTGKGDVGFSGGASLAQVLKFSMLSSDNNKDLDPAKSLNSSSNLSGSFSVVGKDGSSYQINVTANTTINDVVSQLQKAGLNANYDENSQRIFASAKNTGEYSNFTLIGNDEGGMNALAVLGLLSDKDLASAEYTTWAAYRSGAATGNRNDGNYTTNYLTLFDKTVADRAAAFKAQYDALTESNKKLDEDNQKIVKEMDDTDAVGSKFFTENGSALSDIYHDLYDKDGLYDQLQAARQAYEKASQAYANASEDDKDDKKTDLDDKKADLDAIQKQYDKTRAKATDFLDDLYAGKLVDKKDESGNLVYEQKKYDNGELMYEQKMEGGNPVFEADGVTPVYDKTKPVYDYSKTVKVREGGGLADQWSAYQNEGKLPDGVTADELKAEAASYNKWLAAFANTEANRDAIVKNEARMGEVSKYYTVTGTGDDAKAVGTTDLENAVQAEFDKKIDAAKLVTNGEYAALAKGTKIEGQDAEISINDAIFTSYTNTFTVNGLTLTAQEVTSSPVTLTTSTDTDGIYDMIKNFFSEYNKLINEMDSLYNADSSKGYDPLTSEEKDALSDTEVEEWEKKIKDSLLRRDSTLSSVSFSMVSAMLQGAKVNGVQLYLSDFGVNTLGYFKAEKNERNAYHIDGDADDADTRANEDVLKQMIASNPEIVMSFFTQLSTNLYDNLTDKMATSDMSSAFTVYNDKQMKKEYEAYTEKITAQEEKLNALMDKWYSKFSKMEVAMAKLESRSSSLTSLFGG
ncbi:MAG: flagellar filament capping protein FliD [Blautia sp.]|nr:flagellar filament capping protein FliD [Lachnoclostridium sp.]MCM1210214.1 flagellar filament capping protein FliD [Blautia sp.]